MPNWIKSETKQTPAWNGKNAEGKFPLKVNDELIGKYAGRKDGLGPNKNATIFLIKNEAGEEIGVWGSTILSDKLGSLQIGEEVKIIYLGDVQGKNKMNNPYHNYDLYHSGTVDIPTVDEGSIPSFQEQLDQE